MGILNWDLAISSLEFMVIAFSKERKKRTERGGGGGQLPTWRLPPEQFLLMTRTEGKKQGKITK